MHIRLHYTGNVGSSFITVFFFFFPRNAAEQEAREVHGTMLRRELPSTLKFEPYKCVILLIYHLHQVRTIRFSPKGQSIDLRQRPRDIEYMRDAARSDSKPVLFIIKE